MKSYKHLWEQLISPDNIRLAIKNGTKGKRDKPIVQEILEYTEDYIPKIQNYTEHFKSKPHTPKTIYDGISRKKRTIIVPTIEESIIHHMIINVMKPIFMKGMYEHSYASIPGRGPLKGKETVEK